MAEYICPHCKKPVCDDDALLCLFCGESLNRPGKHIPRSRLLFIIIVLLLVLSLLFIFLR
ncbi:MAG: hypothetical protein PHT59_02015 [Candidatus Omnitrophica bacterium]|nr:hypothetical protein [Candidatus Omnitrophota bacterium]